MANLRTTHFDALLSIYSELKNLVKRCNGVVRSALDKISRKLYNLTNWSASNEAYWEYLGYAATRLNILYNSSIDGIIKEIILKIYNKITAILPDNFQLLLFAEESEFGWNFKIDVSNWGRHGIRYIRNAFWDNLVKLFPPSKLKLNAVFSSTDKYEQGSLNLT